VPVIPLETIVGRGDTLSSLLTRGDLFPELKGLSGDQMRNAIGNILNHITPEMRASLSLPDDLKLREGATLSLDTFHEIIENVRINGMTIVERALIERGA
jgi:hypothetical protein